MEFAIVLPRHPKCWDYRYVLGLDSASFCLNPRHLAQGILKHEDNGGEGGRERDEEVYIKGETEAWMHTPILPLASLLRLPMSLSLRASLAILVTPVLQSLGALTAVFLAAVRRGLKLRFLIAPRRSYYLLIRSFWDQHQTRQQ